MNEKNISIQSLSHAGQSFPPSKTISEKAHIRSREEYQKKYPLILFGRIFYLPSYLLTECII